MLKIRHDRHMAKGMLSLTTLPGIILSALLRPSHFIAFLSGGWSNIALALLAMVLWVGAALLFVAVGLVELLPVTPRGVLAGVSIGPLLPQMAVGLFHMNSNVKVSTRVSLSFAIVRCQIVMTPLLAILFAILFSQENISYIIQIYALLLFLLLVGMWAATIITIIALHYSLQNEMLVVRWMVVVAAPSLSIMLWWSPTFPPLSLMLWWLPILNLTDARLLGVCLLGFGIGMIRPLSYVWEATLSSGLFVAAKLKLPPARLRAYHPVEFDELCLLPLPWLARLLVHASKRDLEHGLSWLLDVSEHPTQHRAAEIALRRIADHEDLAHPALLWLSINDRGIALLAALRDRVGIVHPLITAYADAALSDPDAWSSTISQHMPVWELHASLCGGATLLELMRVSAAVLGADRWATAQAALWQLPAAPDVVHGAASPLFHAIQRYGSPQAVLQTVARPDRQHDLRLLDQQISTAMCGWPADLLVIIFEHAVFLRSVEH